MAYLAAKSVRAYNSLYWV